RRHRLLRLADPAEDLVDASGGENPVPGADLQVTGPRVLREVADLPGTHDLAGVLDDVGDLVLPGEQLGQGRLAGAVSPHQPDPHAGVETQVRLMEQLAGADAHGDVVGGDHQASEQGEDTVEGSTAGSAGGRPDESTAAAASDPGDFPHRDGVRC